MQQDIFYFLVSNSNLTLVFHAQLVAIKTDESVTRVYSQNEQSQSSGAMRKMFIPILTLLQ